MFFKISLLTFALFITTHFIQVGAKAEFFIVGKKVECKNGSLLYNVTCSMRNYNKSISLWSVDSYLQEGLIVDNVFGKFSWLYKTFNDQKYKPFLGLSNIVVDLCKYMNDGNAMIIDMFVDELKRAGNLIEKCPLKGHKYMKDFTPNLKRWPAIIPRGEYYIWAIFSSMANNKSELILDLKMYVEVMTVR